MMQYHDIIGIAVWLLGLCIGSFLNVVIYRLPRGLSIVEPTWSFCPTCRQQIRWYDNIPVLSWLILRGRCRRCRRPISIQYPLVEALTGLVFCLVFHLLFVLKCRLGVAGPTLALDTPLLCAWLVLAATMITCAATDLIAYAVDIRAIYFATWAGVILNAVWPRESVLVPLAETPVGLAAAIGGAATVVLLATTVWWRGGDSDDEVEPEAPPPQAPRLAVPLGVAATILCVVLVGWIVAQPGLVAGSRSLFQLAAVPAALVTVFLTVVVVGGLPRPVDEELAAELEEERFDARRNTLRELLWLSPLVGVTLAGGILGWLWPGWSAVVNWSPGGQLVPLAGATYAAHGALVGAVAGWGLRIVFTLVFGREAFGTGDIFILAAAGALAGWDIALLGLFFSVGIALVGWIGGLLLKSTVMIPFGPWLALGFVVALWLNRPAAAIARHYVERIQETWQAEPMLLVIGGGIMLVGTVAAVAIAKGVRFLVEPREN